MAQQKFTNNAVATLSASINSTATTVTVASGQGALFPTLSSGDYFYATIIDSSNNIEIIKVTARSTDSLTVVRAQEGTTGRSFTGGDNISLRVTAAGLNNFAGQDKDNTFSGTNTFSGANTFSSTVTISGTLAVPTQTFGDSDTSAASTAFVQAALAALYPVGSIYTNASVSTNPATLLGFGTWTAFGAGRVMVGFDSGNALFDTVEETGGSADAITVSHTHTATSTSTVTDPGHFHTAARFSGGGSTGVGSVDSDNASVTSTATTGITVGTTTTVNSTGSSGTNANYQPYITVYMWKRTA
jgi:hypothetical protein